MKIKPTNEQAIEAEEALSNAILELSTKARAYRKVEPGETPLWIPRPSTLRYSPLRNGGWIWTMDANDQQVVAFYVVKDESSFVQVTAHGQDRHNFYELLKQKHLFPTMSPYAQWYDYRAQMSLDDKMKKKVVW